MKKKVGVILLAALLAAGFAFTSCNEILETVTILGDGSEASAERASTGDTFRNENKIGTHGSYDFELWRDKGTVEMTLKDGGGFSAKWSNIGNILARKGKKFDSSKTHNQIGQITIDYAAEFTPGGNSYLCIYGWSKDPLVEYYIVENYGTYKPTGTNKGTFNGYDLYETTRTNQPSIEGTKTFKQYWAVRQSKRSSGTVDVTSIFNAWYDKGMSLGKLYEVALTAEGWESNGNANITKNNLTIGGSSSSNTNTNTNTGNNNTTTTTPSSGSETKVTFNGLTQASKSSGVTNASVGDGGRVNLTFNGQYQEVKYNLSSNISLANCSSIVVGGYSPNDTAVKFYDTSGNEAFVMYNLKGSGDWTKTLSSTEKGKTIKSIGIMSQGTAKYDANITFVTFKGVSSSGGTTTNNNNTTTNNNNTTTNNNNTTTTSGETKITFSGLSQASKSGSVTNASVGSNGALNLEFNGQYAEVKYNLSSNISLSNRSSIVVSGYSPNDTAVKFYDTNGKEAFVIYNLKGTINFTKTLSSAEKGVTIKSIGIMSQGAAKYQANINSITIK